MKTITIIAVLILGIATIGKAEDARSPLIIDAQPQWTVEFEGDKGIQFFTIARTEGEPAHMMFSRWPAPGNNDQIHKLVESIAKGFAEQAKLNPAIKLDSDQYVIEKIKGIEFSGEYASFQVSNGILQTIFMISNGDGIWSGQYSGSKERWIEAIDILKKIKKS